MKWNDHEPAKLNKNFNATTTTLNKTTTRQIVVQHTDTETTWLWLSYN